MADAESSNAFTAILAIVIAVASGGFSLLGVWLGGRSGLKQARVTMEEAARLQERRDMLSRLEELYQLVDRWEKTLIGYHITLRSVMQGAISYNDALDMRISRKGEVIDVARMTALAEHYFPNTKTAYQALLKARDRAAAIQGDYKAEYKRVGPQAGDKSAEIEAAVQELGAAVDAYKSELARYVEAA